jgi:tRNA nucleotidyltransferase (CCA-adding enzyme)
VSPDISAVSIHYLTAKLSPKDLAALKASFVRPGFVEEWNNLDEAAKEFGKQLSSKEAATPSAAWKLFTTADPQAVLWLGLTSKSAAIKEKYRLFFSVWPEARQKIPYALFQEMRITPEVPGYEELIAGLFLGTIDGKLETEEELRAFLAPYSPPAPPPPVTVRRTRGSKKSEAKVKAPVETDFDGDPLDLDDDDSADEAADDPEVDAEVEDDEDDSEVSLPPAPKKTATAPVKASPKSEVTKEPVRLPAESKAQAAPVSAVVTKPKTASIHVVAPVKPEKVHVMSRPAAKGVAAEERTSDHGNDAAAAAKKTAPVKTMKTAAAKPAPAKAVAKSAPLKSAPPKPVASKHVESKSPKHVAAKHPAKNGSHATAKPVVKAKKAEPVKKSKLAKKAVPARKHR